MPDENLLYAIVFLFARHIWQVTVYTLQGHKSYNKEEYQMKNELNKHSFILGMITAFSECVAGGCKRMALSPPLAHDDYVMIVEDANILIEKHGLIHYHEENLDLPENKRFDWILIAGKQAVIDDYLELRKQGISPAKSLEPFYELLSYQPEKSIHTGYDAYQDYWGKSKDKKDAN